MIDALLAVDSAVNLGLGIILVLYPARLIRLLGIPDVRPSFYARVLGGVLFGIGLALALEVPSAESTTQGLGAAGAVAINLCGAAVLAGALLTQRLDIPLRGHVLLWGLFLVLIGLSAAELMWI